MLTNKEKMIVQHLLEHKEDFTSGLVLAGLLSCSDRTIRTYIKSIADTLDKIEGVELLAKQGQGYRLQFSDETVYRSFLKQFGHTDSPTTGNSDINDRQSYILNKLLLEQESLFFDDLAEELYVSRSTLSSDFKKIRKDLAAYDLTIESKANKGVYVKGEEQAIRRFIMDYFFNSSFFQTLYQYVGEELAYGKINFEALTVIVLDECREADLRLSDFVIQNLVVHIALALRRLAEGFQISAVEENLSQKYPKEYQAAQRILGRITVATRLDFPAEEVSYITLHLIAKGQLSQGDQDYSERIREELLVALAALPGLGALQQDFQFLEGLLTHLNTLSVRLRSHIVLENPLLEDIRANYSSAFDEASHLLEAMSSFAEQNLSDDEIAYVALHVMAAKERLRNRRKYNVLVICATGFGSAQMLRSRIENELRQHVHIVDVIGYYEITDQKLKGIDFIISSIDLSNLIFSLPVFTTSVFLKEEELIAIRHQIEELPQAGYQLAERSREQRLDPVQLFDEYFSPQAFYRHPGGEIQKSEVLKALVQGLSQDEEEGFVPRMLDLMAQREGLSSVVFSESIAVPHPIKPLASRLKLAVGLVPQGLAWEEGFDRIQLIFLPALSKEHNEELKPLTKAIVDLVDQPDYQEKLLAARTFEEFRQVMLEYLGGR